MDTTKDEFLQFLEDCVDDDGEEHADDMDEEIVEDKTVISVQKSDSRVEHGNNPGLDSKAPVLRLSTAGISKVRQNCFEHEEWAQPFVGTENLWLCKDVPHHGWECVTVIDLGELVGICRMCGKQIIRYVHVMKHPNYYRTIGAGCVCAGKMQLDIAKARERERLFKNRQGRMQRFIRKYIKYFAENPVMPMRIEEPNSEKRILNILIRKHRKGYLYRYDEMNSKIYGTLEEVLGAVYDIIDPLKLV